MTEPGGFRLAPSNAWPGALITSAVAPRRINFLPALLAAAVPSSRKSFDIGMYSKKLNIRRLVKLGLKAKGKVSKVQ
jgi:hypothetical protein